MAVSSRLDHVVGQFVPRLPADLAGRATGGLDAGHDVAAQDAVGRCLGRRPEGEHVRGARDAEPFVVQPRDPPVVHQQQAEFRPGDALSGERRLDDFREPAARQP